MKSKARAVLERPRSQREGDKRRLIEIYRQVEKAKSQAQRDRLLDEMAVAFKNAASMRQLTITPNPQHCGLRKKQFLSDGARQRTEYAQANAFRPKRPGTP